MCTLFLQKVPQSELVNDANPPVDALSHWQKTDVQAYVVHVDMVSQNEVAFKLTPETINILVE